MEVLRIEFHPFDRAASRSGLGNSRAESFLEGTCFAMEVDLRYSAARPWGSVIAPGLEEAIRQLEG